MNVVIVGGGASGLLVALWLMRTGTQADTVVVIDHGDDIGEGAAYARKNTHFLLNVRAIGMSAYHDQPMHFVQWLKEHKDYHDAEGFVPRHWYAEYLRHEVAVQIQQSSVQLIIHRGTAQQVDRMSHVVMCTDGKRYPADVVVMALGNLASHNPIHRWNTAPTRMVDWRRFRTDMVSVHDTVVIVGTGLTMVDQIIALHESGHTGQIIAVSRHGYLPMTHVARQPYPCPVTVADADMPLSDLMRTMRSAVHEAQHAGVPWQAVIDSIRPHTQAIWRQWNSDTQRRFLRHLRAVWDIHRHRMAPEISHRINQLITTGQLHVLAGRIHDYQEMPDGVRITLEKRGETRVIEGGIVVNCTGPTSNYVTAQVPILYALATQGVVVPHATGIGLQVNEVGQVRNASGAVEPWLWCIGPMRKGNDWECTAIPDIRVQAHQLVSALQNVERGATC
jgi:uncharacterized NAD(P)/FAD-binding protein YdhS